MRLTATKLAHYRVLIVGGGSAGNGMSHKMARALGNKQVGLIEPNETHYYQPGFTLVGGGLMSLEANTRKQADIIHPKVDWIKQKVEKFSPKINTVKTSDGTEHTYDYLILATGCQAYYGNVKGLEAAITEGAPGICSNYLPHLAQKTYKELMAFKEGTALFTFPLGTLKCPGAPQKICYISDEVLRNRGVRDKAKLIYSTALPRIFGLPHYAKSLMKVVEEKNIELRIRRDLIEVDAARKVATFELLDEDGNRTGKTEQVEYSMMHVGPVCRPAAVMRACPDLTDANGWVDVHPKTLQSTRYPNVFAVGDCSNSPNAKTAAAISSQMKALEKNLKAVLAGGKMEAKYDGYASCPLVVGTHKVILAEFDSEGPLETLPMDGSVPRVSSYWMKRYFMPWLYWHGLVKGYWNGPATLRTIFHLGLNKK